MIVSIKDSIKLAAISIVCICAVFVCTFFLNFYIDVLPLGDTIEGHIKILYDAQVAMAKFTSAISGGFMGAIAVVMTIFYIKLYIDGHSKQLGILKAMGYSNGKLALRFWVFGLCVLVGCVVGHIAGFIAMPYIYEQLTVDGIGKIDIGYHPVLTVCLVVLPPIAVAGISILYAYIRLGRPVGEMLKGLNKPKQKAEKIKTEKEHSFLVEMGLKTVSSKKMLAFFVAFSCFCFSAMVQMGLSMEDLTSASMGYMILGIGVVLAVVSMIMAITSLINGNVKNVSLMKAMGFSMKECVLSIFAGFLPFAVIGFAVGTGYQYGLLQLMINIVFKDVAGVPEYSFNVEVFFITLAVFIVAYATVMLVCILKLRKVSVKEIMLEN